MKMLMILAAFSFAACGLSITPTTLDVKAMKAYMRPTDHSKPNKDLDLTSVDDFLLIDKNTCFNPDDLAVIKRKLNNCKN